MNRIVTRATVVCAVAGVMVAGLVQGATIRYAQSGDWFALQGVDGYGWQSTNVPGIADTARFNWGSNTVTLDAVAPDIDRFQMGVDESGGLIVNSGGSLTSLGTSKVGNNNNCTGFLTINAGGSVAAGGDWMMVAGSSTVKGILTLDGGTLDVNGHLWGATGAGSTALININSGTLSVGSMLGLGTIDAVNPSGGVATLTIDTNGVVALSNIHAAGTSIHLPSRIDIKGGTLTLPGDFTDVLTNNYTSSGKIVGYGGAGSVQVMLDVVGSTTNTVVTATPGPPPPPEVVWDPASNTNSSEGLWSDPDNWGGAIPGSTTKAVFNVPGAIPCKVTSAASASQIDSGDTGPGGMLIVTNGGFLSVGNTNASVIGENDSGALVIGSGALGASFAHDLFIGLNGGSSGVFTMYDGEVNVAGMFELGGNGGTGTANIHGGILNLAQFTFYPGGIQGASVLDVAGSGRVVISGFYEFDVLDYIDSGHITANGIVNPVVGVDIFVSYDIGSDETLISAEVIPPDVTVWNPAANPSSDGLWNNSTNWTQGLPGVPTKVVLNVPGAIDCVVSSQATCDQIVLGDNGPGGLLVVTNGGTLNVLAVNESWSGIGYNSNATMVVEEGGSVSFGNHLWVGQNAGADGTLIMNGGEVFVAEMFGLGRFHDTETNSTGTALITGGTLNLHNLHETRSITGDSVLDVSGTGLVLIDGDKLARVADYVAAGKIKSGGTSNVIYYYDSVADQTVITTVAPPRDITGITVAGGTVTLSYDAFAGQTYHIESASSLTAPIVWTPVVGTTTNAAGSSVTTSFPVGGNAETFYRTVSP